ncbi:hypothetical protein [Pelagibacterium montanilacus]|uniref:hypothetical protein n=1 Tax=Pelagibacterium montanilacus TaxID=2185280 RepID=UPI000F8C3903|nr:hypothetical protein [Pelagibacterium montanilacus]
MPPMTPDRRYIVVKGRLWRATRPDLSESEQTGLVASLMRARRDVREAVRSSDKTAEADARARVDAAKRGLGERGPVWWSDGAPDYNRHMIENTPYAHWWSDKQDSDDE